MRHGVFVGERNLLREQVLRLLRARGLGPEDVLRYGAKSPFECFALACAQRGDAPIR